MFPSKVVFLERETIAECRVKGEIGSILRKVEEAHAFHEGEEEVVSGFRAKINKKKFYYTRIFYLIIRILYYNNRKAFLKKGRNDRGNNNNNIRFRVQLFS